MSHVNFELPNYPNDRLPFQCNFCHGFPHWHWHKAPELLYGMEGQSLVYCNDRKIVLKPEETVYINPEILHAIEASRARYICRYGSTRVFIKKMI